MEASGINREELSKEIARGIAETGIEGTYDTAISSTAGDYPCIGISSWESNRADSLLAMIDGGSYYANRAYSDIRAAGELPALRNLLASEQGRAAQLEML